MSAFIHELSLRWSDMDPNFHMRHSAYYDFGAQIRLQIMQSYGISTLVMQTDHFGPVLFREECIFRREIKLTDRVFLSTEIEKMRSDASRWTFLHRFHSEDASILHATLTVDGAWMDTALRKLCNPVPEVVQKAMNDFPRSSEFELV